MASHLADFLRCHSFYIHKSGMLVIRVLKIDQMTSSGIPPAYETMY